MLVFIQKDRDELGKGLCKNSSKGLGQKVCKITRKEKGKKVQKKSI